MSTKLYLHNAVNALTGTFPSGEQSSAVAGWTATGASTLRSMNATIGTAQSSLAGNTLASASAQKGFMGFFTSNPFTAVGLVGSSTWANHAATISVGRYASAGFGTAAAGAVSGGYTGSSSAVTDEFNGTTFSAGGNLLAATRWGRACGTQTAGLYAGGYRSSAQTLVAMKYDGAAYSSTGSLLNTAGEGIGCNGSQSAAIRSGGYVSGTNHVATVETFDGTTWANAASMTRIRAMHASVGTPADTIAICGRTSTLNQRTADSETFNGSAWSAIDDFPYANEGVVGYGASSSDALAAGGAVSGVAVSYCATYNGTAWVGHESLTDILYAPGAFGGTTDGLAAGGYKDGSSQYLTATKNMTAQNVVALGGSITLNVADAESNLAANTHVNGLSLYIWRPSTGAVVAYLLDTGGSLGGTEPTAQDNQQVNHIAGVMLVPQAAREGDVIIAELWAFHTQAAATSYMATVYFDGTAENTTENAVVSDHASFVEFSDTLQLQGYSYAANLFYDSTGQLVIASSLPGGGAYVIAAESSAFSDVVPWFRGLDADGNEWHPANYYGDGPESTRQIPGGNIMPNSDMAFGADYWEVLNNAGGGTNYSGPTRDLSDNAPAGSHSVGVSRTGTTQAASDVFDIVYNKRINVLPSTRYEQSGYLAAEDCTPAIFPKFYKLVGGVETAVSSSDIFTAAAAAGGDDLSGWNRAGGFFTTPADAQYVKFCIRGSAASAADPVFWGAKLFLGQAYAGQTELSPWTAGGNAGAYGELPVLSSSHDEYVATVTVSIGVETEIISKTFASVISPTRERKVLICFFCESRTLNTRLVRLDIESGAYTNSRTLYSAGVDMESRIISFSLIETIPAGYDADITAGVTVKHEAAVDRTYEQITISFLELPT
jgi:hypothetical protein